MKPILFALFLLSTPAFGGWFASISKISANQIHHPGYGIHAVVKYCWKECILIGIKPEARYGRKFEVYLTEAQGKNFFNKFGNTDFIDPIAVFYVAETDYPHIRVTGEPTKGPPDGYVPATDPDIGMKMLYCTASAFSCGNPITSLFEGKGAGVFSLIGSCAAATVKTCDDFFKSWEKERAAIGAMQQWNRSQGIGAAPNGGSGGVAAIGAGAQPGVGTGPGTSEPGMGGQICVPNTVSMGGGPIGEKIEVPSIDCYYE